MEQDKFLQEFQRIYNRMYSRYYRRDAWDSLRQSNKLTEAEFKVWIDMASKARLAYKLGVRVLMSFLTFSRTIVTEAK